MIKTHKLALKKDNSNPILGIRRENIIASSNNLKVLIIKIRVFLFLQNQSNRL